MRNLMAGLAAILFPMLASAQETKPVQPADYVSFCLSIWTDAPDVQAKASALGLLNGFGVLGHATIGKSTLQVYKSAWSNQIAQTTTTIFADGKELFCEVTMPGAHSPTELGTMERTLRLDGQTYSNPAGVIGHWKMPDRRLPVLLEAVMTKSNLALRMQQFEPAAEDSTRRH